MAVLGRLLENRNMYVSENNYRPVSILPLISKLTANRVLDEFHNHCDAHLLN